MSGVLHPVGPEPARTYWIRRGVLLAVVLLLALGVVVAVSSLTKAAVATAPPPAIAPPGTSPSPTASATSASPSAVSPGAVSPGRSPSAASSTPTTPSARTAEPTPSATGSAGTSTAKPSTTARAKPSATATTAGTPDCKPSDLKVTLKGDRTLSPGQRNKFTLTLVNGGRQTCLASVTDRNFELKVYSGTDRIWSSRDCSKVLAAFDKKLAAKADVGWTMTWNGERSVKGKKCDNAPETPQAGTYWATAQLDGADPVQLRMIIS